MPISNSSQHRPGFGGIAPWKAHGVQHLAVGGVHHPRLYPVGELVDGPLWARVLAPTMSSFIP